MWPKAGCVGRCGDGAWCSLMCVQKCRCCAALIHYVAGVLDDGVVMRN